MEEGQSLWHDFPKGEQRLQSFKVYATIDFALLGPRNYETVFLISEADQLLKVRRVFLFWFRVLCWLCTRQHRGFCTGLMLCYVFSFLVFGVSWLFFLLLCTDSSVYST